MFWEILGLAQRRRVLRVVPYRRARVSEPADDSLLLAAQKHCLRDGGESMITASVP